MIIELFLSFKFFKENVEGLNLIQQKKYFLLKNINNNINFKYNNKLKKLLNFSPFLNNKLIEHSTRMPKEYFKIYGNQNSFIRKFYKPLLGKLKHNQKMTSLKIFF